MIEPEMAFYDLKMDMDVIEDFHPLCGNYRFRKIESWITNFGTRYYLPWKSSRAVYPYEIWRCGGCKLKAKGNWRAHFAANVAGKRVETSTNWKLPSVEAEIAEREAKIASGELKKGEVNFNQSKIDKLKNEAKELDEKLMNIPVWLNSAKNFKRGDDFGGSDETVLTKMFGQPVMVYNWPQEVKAFYMKEDETDKGYAKGVVSGSRRLWRGSRRWRARNRFGTPAQQNYRARFADGCFSNGT